jgi:hypothetical protein
MGDAWISPGTPQRGASAPQPGDRGAVDRLTRYRVLRDGIAECIFALPMSDKGVARKLQEAWLMVDSTVARLKAEQPPEWPNLLQE